LLFSFALPHSLIRGRGRLDGIAGMAVLRFAVWSFGLQQTRFLSSLFPDLSLFVVGALAYLTGRLQALVVERQVVDRAADSRVE